MRSVVLALGSNLGDSPRILQGAIDDLSATEGLELTDASAVYETDPVGGPDQPAYLNAIVLGRTSLRDHELLEAVHSVEGRWGRTRAVRWEPRTLDVDIVAVDDDRSDDPLVTLPHPRAHERAFVLVPWLDVDPEAAVAGRGRVADLVEQVGAAGVRRTAVALVVRPGPDASRE